MDNLVTVAVEIGQPAPKLGVPFISVWGEVETVFIPTVIISLEWKIYKKTDDCPEIKQLMVTMDGVRYTKDEYKVMRGDKK